MSGAHGKNRPALVVQCDQNNGRLSNTIVAMITGNTRLAAAEPTQVLIDPAAPEGKSSGLRAPSAVKCENLFTIAQGDILATIGSLSLPLMRRVDAALRAAPLCPHRARARGFTRPMASSPNTRRALVWRLPAKAALQPNKAPGASPGGPTKVTCRLPTRLSLWSRIFSTSLLQPKYLIEIISSPNSGS